MAVVASDTSNTLEDSSLKSKHHNERIEDLEVAYDPKKETRTAKWYSSAFHNVTAMVGAGVLGFPYTMKFLGWGPGIAVQVTSWMVTLYTLWQLTDMHEMIPGRRFDRYYELSQYAFGPKLGLWILVPPNLVVEVGVDIVYMVTGGQSLKKFHETVCRSCTELRQSYWILIFGSLHFVLAQLPNLNSISAVSLAAAMMSLSYSTIAWGACLYHGKAEEVSYGASTTSLADSVFGVLNSLGVIAFAYAGHNVALEIQATIPSPSKGPMWRGILLAYVVAAACYFPVTIVGYWAFGDSVGDNLLITLRHPDWIIAAANIMVVIHVIGSYQVFAMPVYDMLEKLLNPLHGLSKTPFIFRIIVRSAYVAFTIFIAVSFPFFGDLLGFFGGLAFAPTTYFLPCLMWLALRKPRRWSMHWLANWFCIIFGSSIMVISTIGGFRNILVDVSTYKFYQ